MRVEQGQPAQALFHILRLLPGVVEVLLDAGASLVGTDVRGFNALHYAASGGKTTTCSAPDEFPLVPLGLFGARRTSCKLSCLTFLRHHPLSTLGGTCNTIVFFKHPEGGFVDFGNYEGLAQSTNHGYVLSNRSRCGVAETLNRTRVYCNYVSVLNPIYGRFSLFRAYTRANSLRVTRSLH